MKYLITNFCTITIFLSSCKESNPKQKLPWHQQVIKENEIDEKYLFNGNLKPSSLEADFNGDGLDDMAISITEKSTGMAGILIMHNRTNDYYILGGGSEFDNGGNDFKWVDKWSVYRDTVAYETKFDEKSGDLIGSEDVNLVNPGILVMKHEDSAPVTGGIIHYQDKKYNWIHQGE